MKLRNKKTGEVKEFNEIFLTKTVNETNTTTSEYIERSYCKIAELNEEWEDYAPKEPLVKDERIRKAVRAWAEADDLDNFRVQNQHFNACKIIGYTAGINKASFIGFQTTIAHADNTKLYTIDELCGEEE